MKFKSDKYIMWCKSGELYTCMSTVVALLDNAVKDEKR